MNRSAPLFLIIMSVLLTGCDPSTNTLLDTESGSMLSANSASSATSANQATATSNLSWSSTRRSVNPAAAQAELQLVYDNAVFVRDLTEAVWDDLSTDEQAILEDVLHVFSQDIETLGYYLEVSEHEPLTDEEQELLLTIMTDIEAAMELLAQAIERLL